MLQPVRAHWHGTQGDVFGKQETLVSLLFTRKDQVLTEVWLCFSSKVGDTYKLATKRAQTVKGKEGTEMMSLVLYNIS